MVPAGWRVRLRRPGRDLRARHGPRGDLRPPGFGGAVAAASRSAFLAGSGGDAGRWRRGVLDGVDRGVGGVLRSVADVLRRVVDGFVGDGCCVADWSGGYERSRRRGAASRHDRADRFRSQRPRTERSPAERCVDQRSRSQRSRSQRYVGEHSRGQRSVSQCPIGKRSPCQRCSCQCCAGQCCAGQCSGRSGYRRSGERGDRSRGCPGRYGGQRSRSVRHPDRPGRRAAAGHPARTGQHQHPGSRYRRLDLHGFRPGRCGTGPGRDLSGQRSRPSRHPDRRGRRQRKSADRSAGTGQPADAAKHSGRGHRRR